MSPEGWPRTSCSTLRRTTSTCTPPLSPGGRYAASCASDPGSPEADMRYRVVVALAGLSLVLTTASPAHGDNTVAPGGGTPGTASNVVLVGHDPLFNRGMNAALAIFKHYVYIGNRSDGSNSCGDLSGTGPVVPVLPPTNPDGTC